MKRSPKASKTATPARSKSPPPKDAGVLRTSGAEATSKRKSIASLQDSELRFRRIVEMAEEGVWKIDADSLTDYVNPNTVQMMGYSAEEMI